MMLRNYFQLRKSLKLRLQGFPYLIKLKPIENKFGLSYKPTKEDCERVKKNWQKFKPTKLQGCKPNIPNISIPYIRVNFLCPTWVLNFEESLKKALAKLSINALERDKQNQDLVSSYLIEDEKDELVKLVGKYLRVLSRKEEEDTL